MTQSVTLSDVKAAHLLIESYIHRTPVITSRFVDDSLGASVFFKCENLQKVGAFKARGALNAVLSLGDSEARRGVITHSSGNHGQAVAYACGIRDIPVTVVMPDHAPEIKVAAVKGYGATVIQVPHEQRSEAVERLVAEQGLTEVHPFDDVRVIAGQATAALELLEAGQRGIEASSA